MEPTQLSAYDFQLPEELIAQKPADRRDESRLMLIERASGKISHHRFRDLPALLSRLLPQGALLIGNNSRVIRARLLGNRLREERGVTVVGGKVEFLLLERRGERQWEGAFHAAAKHKPGVEFQIPAPDGSFIRGVLVRGASDSAHGTVVAEFDRDPVEAGAGEMPLPPYITRNPESSDSERYQTVYAKEEGSAAAPTAGLHFTPELISDLNSKGFSWKEITLHVGLGTFRPVKAEDIREHQMHEERFSIPEETAGAVNEASSKDRRVIAVGTTVVRTLEGQALERGSAEGGVAAGPGRTSLFIYPGAHEFRVVEGLITNFHLPKSSLLMLVSAFAGRELVIEAYQEAIRERYRFFSYGDAMLIL